MSLTVFFLDFVNLKTVHNFKSLQGTLLTLCPEFIHLNQSATVDPPSMLGRPLQN